jgi:tetratricopeptide (TPR) repeat protein
MGTQMANDYYLKALDSYPYDLQEFLENINYALSYDEDHADAHCLMGQFYKDQLYKFDDARYHFERALVTDMNHVMTYYHYIYLCIITEDFERGIKLIRLAEKIAGINKATLFHREALLYEQKENYKKATKLLDKALVTTIYTNDADFFKAELTRLKAKKKGASDSNSKKKSKKRKNNFSTQKHCAHDYLL